MVGSKAPLVPVMSLVSLVEGESRRPALAAILAESGNRWLFDASALLRDHARVLLDHDFSSRPVFGIDRKLHVPNRPVIHANLVITRRAASRSRLVFASVSVRPARP